MSQFSYPALEFLEARNQVVEGIIKDTAVKHAALDAVIDGAAGASPFPGTVGVALAGQLFMQVKTIYPHMIKKIALAYAAEPDAYTKKQARKATVEEGVVAALIFASENGVLEEVGSQLKDELAAQFGSEFLQQMIKDALGESLAGLGLAQVPWFGAPAGAAVAAALAWKLTWRVGLVVSVYFQNGEAFIGTRKQTAQVVKREFVHGQVPTDLTGSVDSIRRRLPEVMRSMAQHAATEVEASRATGAEGQQVRQNLEAKGYPADVIEAALHPVR